MLSFTPREPLAIALRRDVPWSVAVAALGVIMLVADPGSGVVPGLFGEGAHPALFLVPLAITAVAAAFTSALPVPALLLACVGVAVSGLTGTHITVQLEWSSTIYGLWRYGAARDRRIGVGLLIATSGIVIACVAIGTRSTDATTSMTLQVMLVCALPMWWSSELRAGDELAEAERLRAAVAVQADREAVARDLHDTVSAHLSAITIFSAGALDGAPDAERDRRALAEVRRASLAALGEMRQLIDVLRSDSTPEPIAATTLDAEVARAQQAGLEIEVSGELVVQADGALGEVAREALGNALKYGDGTATLRLETDDDRLALEIENPIADAPRGGSSGLGLGQMARRMRGAGGRFSAGESAGAGRNVWRVRAEVPR
ncbi:sensor histidine kinase [Gulosibacter sediminis]|uniref:sensor histidine kinase n=1 Tax=Gulosibacter sediminis TaxID=1729695 RepID=UPI0024AE52A5|nr:histidine kinase [Gulosibacter sediminis]